METNLCKLFICEGNKTLELSPIDKATEAVHNMKRAAFRRLFFTEQNQSTFESEVQGTGKEWDVKTGKKAKFQYTGQSSGGKEIQHVASDLKLEERKLGAYEKKGTASIVMALGRRHGFVHASGERICCGSGRFERGRRANRDHR